MVTPEKVERQRVLVIEDSADIRLLLRKHLEKMGMEVEEAAGGYAALGTLRRIKEPDVVILDLILPERSGVELLCSLRAKWQLVKVFVFSGHEEYKQKTVLQEYINGFFLKSEGMRSLLSAVKKILK